MTGTGVQLQRTTLFLVGEVGARVQTLPEYERVVIHLGVTSDVSVHLDRDGIALLESVLDHARTELDAAVSEQAAASEARVNAAVARERALSGDNDHAA